MSQIDRLAGTEVDAPDRSRRAAPPVRRLRPLHRLARDARAAAAAAGLRACCPNWKGAATAACCWPTWPPTRPRCWAGRRSEWQALRRRRRAAAEERQGAGARSWPPASRCGRSASSITTSRWCSTASACTCAATGATKRWSRRRSARARAALPARSTPAPGARAGSTCCSPRSAQARGRTGRSWPARSPLRGRLAIITGGPGTGKTYTVARLLALLFATAPDAGTAAHRAGRADRQGGGAPEAVDRQGARRAGRPGRRRAAAARTDRAHGRGAHPAQPAGRAPRHAAPSPTTRGNPLDVDVLIVDEASMVHLEMMAALLDALPPTRDADPAGRQGPAGVGGGGRGAGRPVPRRPGRRLRRETAGLCARGQRRGRFPPAFLGDGGALAQQTVMLRHSRRFGGPIGQLALAVNAGDAAARRGACCAAAADRHCAGSSTRSQQQRAAAGAGRLPPYLAAGCGEGAGRRRTRTGCARCCSASKPSASCARCAKASGAWRA